MSIYKDILSLIPRDWRLKTFMVLILVFFGMLLEMIGVGLIIPIFTLILNSDNAKDSQLVNYFFEIFNISNADSLISISLFGLILIYLIKASYLSMLSWVQAKFVFSLQADISNRLFKTYLGQPYSFHLKSNSAFLIRNITTETQVLVEATFLSFMLIVNELVVLVGLILLMFYLTPVKALVLVVIILIGALIIQYLTKDLLLAWGLTRQENEGLKIKAAQEGLGGIKDVLILGRKQEILGQFNRSVIASTSASANRYAVQQLPRIWIEVLGIVSLIIIIFIDLYKGISPTEVIPSIAFIAAIAFRVMPSSNRFLSSIQSIKFSTPIVSLLKEQLSLSKKEEHSFNNIPLVFKEKIEIKDLRFGYKDEKEIIKGISLDIPKGRKIGIVGSSGSGKSTFIDLMLGLNDPSSGLITVDKVDIKNNLRGWQDILGYVPQNIFLSDDSIRRNIAFGIPEEEIDDDDINYALEMAQLVEFVEDSENGLNTILGERGVRLSGGQKQRLGIARALYQRPDILILDEATSSLDTPTEKEVMNSIYSLESSITIIIIAHRLSTLENCDEVITLNEGKLIRG